MKKLICTVLFFIICLSCLVPTALALESSMREAATDAKEDMEGAVSTAKDAIKDAITDIREDMDYDPDDGKPLAEGDGKVDREDETSGRDTTDRDTTDRDTTDRSTTDRDTDADTTKDRPSTESDRTEESTGIIEGMELEENGINPWIVGFIASATICTWNTLPQSIPYLSAFGATDGYVEYGHTVKMSVFVMVWQIVALLVSIPFWSLMGMC